MERFVEKQLMRRLNLRLVPLLIFLYVIAYLDRVNLSFAALTMNEDIGLDPYHYGLGAGIFFLGYCLFEIPSNLVPVRVGTRWWIARILLLWGLLASRWRWFRDRKVLWSCGFFWVPQRQGISRESFFILHTGFLRATGHASSQDSCWPSRFHLP